MNIMNDGRFPGGPTTAEVINVRKSHRCRKIWDGNLDYNNIRTRFHGRILKDMMKEEGGLRRVKLEAIGFGHLSSITWLSTDVTLCFILAEHFWPKTLTFHMPCGEMAITLEDTMYILGLPIVGLPLVPVACNDYLDLVRRCLGKIPQSTRDLVLVSKGKIRIHWLKAEFSTLPDDPTPLEVENYTRAYILAVCGCFLFPDSSGSTIKLEYLKSLENLDEVRNYCWGGAVLAYLYKGLTDSTFKNSCELRGCIPLLQVWSYLHFPHIGRPVINPNNVGRVPLAAQYTGDKTYASDPHGGALLYHQEFDHLTNEKVVWAPYPAWDEAGADLLTHVKPLICWKIIMCHPVDRCKHQLRMLQDIPNESIVWSVSSVGKAKNAELIRAYEAWNTNASDYAIRGLLLNDEQVPNGITPGYQQWYGHPIMYNVALTYSEARYVPRGYRDKGFEILYQRCLDEANTLDRLKNRYGNDPDLQVVIDRLRNMDDFPKDISQQREVPVRRVKWQKVNEVSFEGDGDDTNEVEYYVPAPVDENEADTLRDSSDRSYDSASSSQVPHTPFDNGPSSSTILPYSSHPCGQSSSTFMALTPPDLIPPYIPEEISQDVSQCQVDSVSRPKRKRKETRRIPTKIQMCSYCSRSGSRCPKHQQQKS